VNLPNKAQLEEPKHSKTRGAGKRSVFMARMGKNWVEACEKGRGSVLKGFFLTADIVPADQEKRGKNAIQDRTRSCLDKGKKKDVHDEEQEPTEKAAVVPTTDSVEWS